MMKKSDFYRLNNNNYKRCLPPEYVIKRIHRGYEFVSNHTSKELADNLSDWKLFLIGVYKFTLKSFLNYNKNDLKALKKLKYFYYEISIDFHKKVMLLNSNDVPLEKVYNKLFASNFIYLSYSVLEDKFSWLVKRYKLSKQEVAKILYGANRNFLNTDIDKLENYSSYLKKTFDLADKDILEYLSTSVNFYSNFDKLKQYTEFFFEKGFSKESVFQLYKTYRLLDEDLGSIEKKIKILDNFFLFLNFPIRNKYYIKFLVRLKNIDLDKFKKNLIWYKNNIYNFSPKNKKINITKNNLNLFFGIMLNDIDELYNYYLQLGFTKEEIAKLVIQTKFLSLFISKVELEKKISFAYEVGLNEKHIKNLLKMDSFYKLNIEAFKRELLVLKENNLLFLFNKRSLYLITTNIINSVKWLKERKIPINKKFIKILLLSVSNLEKKRNWFKKQGFTDNEIRIMLNLLPNLFTYSLERISKKINWLKKKGLSFELIKFISLYFPALYSISLSTLRKKWKWFNKKGLTDKTIVNILQVNPTLFSSSVEYYERNWKYLKKYGIDTLYVKYLNSLDSISNGEYLMFMLSAEKLYSVIKKVTKRIKITKNTELYKWNLLLGILDEFYNLYDSYYNYKYKANTRMKDGDKPYHILDIKSSSDYFESLHNKSLNELTDNL